ncbi:hypothetical protein ASE86_01440 [Sphingomonas sp. Leaf33]|uniref:DUF3667 domain-containing protein n=1 Tax=Sphingomonas sp. Leaf33 TaxID=1736215 RepID=UPI0006F53079|nr:DUF3667 domain-containing protein [Sphingomonas sp. Leaf33]KQN26774.1 hypothetical protein ASE86_01440 [Sphingomonas sp. Leaf33]
MGEFDAAADVVTGGLMGRAVEPHAGDHRAGGHDADGHGLCANCGTPLIGSHCHACGQVGHVHRTLGAYGHDLLHGVFHFEGKIWATLPMLALKPGELTRRYIAGERAKFVSPIALFLFSVFLMFAVVANLPGWSFGGDEWLKPGLTGGMARAREKLVDQRQAADRAVVKLSKELKAERAAATPDTDEIADLRRRLAETLDSRAKLKQAEALLPAPTPGDDDGLPRVTSAPGSPGGSWIEQKWEHVRENPKLTLYKIKTSAYKYSWALIPLSLPFLWLLFPLRRDVGLYDHAIFATYSLTFMSLLVIVLALLGAIGVPSWIILVAALGIPPFHMYRQLKGAYRLSRAGALWRLHWLLFFTSITTLLFTMLLLYLGAAD